MSHLLFIAIFTNHTTSNVPAGSVLPSAGSGSQQRFAFHLSDPNGAANLSTVLVLWNTALERTGACYFWYNPGTNTFALDSDAYVWSASLPLGGGTALENSRCRLNLAVSSVIVSGNELTLNISVDFKAGFAGPKYTYLYVNNRLGLTSGWQQVGAWTTR